MNLSYEFRRFSEYLATKVRYELDLKAYDPLPALMLVDHLEVELFRPGNLPNLPQSIINYLCSVDTWSAVLLDTSSRQIIFNPRHSDARRESSLMHEMGHILLGHPLQEIKWHNGQMPYREYDSLIETEAAYLGGALQVPRRAVLWSLQQNMSRDDIADFYGCSTQMAQWRINTI